MSDKNPAQDETQTNPNGHTGNVILHLSDLHFKEESDPILKAKRNNTLRDLVECIKNEKEVHPTWAPTIICLTGDIAYTANPEEYKLALNWIKLLLHELEIDSKNLIICPGNHDVNIDTIITQQIKQPKNKNEANNAISIPIPKLYDNIFKEYIDFCGDFIEPAKYGDHQSYLFGIRCISGIYFLICNSCWFFNNNANNKSDLWIGERLYEYIEQELKGFKKKGKVIAIMHHPERCLHEDEIVRSPRNNPTYLEIKNNTDLILSGHLHSLPCLDETSHCITVGAGYGGVDGRNAFCLIKIEQDLCFCQYYTSDPSRVGNKWLSEGKPVKIIFKEALYPYALYLERGGSSISLNSQQIKIEISQKTPKDNFLTTKIDEPITNMSDDITNIMHIIEDVEMQLNKAQIHINKLEYSAAFEIASEVREQIKDIDTLQESYCLADIYISLANIEITKVNCLYHQKRSPKDYSIAKEYYEKAKICRRK